MLRRAGRGVVVCPRRSSRPCAPRWAGVRCRCRVRRFSPAPEAGSFGPVPVGLPAPAWPAPRRTRQRDQAVPSTRARGAWRPAVAVVTRWRPAGVQDRSRRGPSRRVHRRCRARQSRCRRQWRRARGGLRRGARPPRPRSPGAGQGGEIPVPLVVPVRGEPAEGQEAVRLVLFPWSGWRRLRPR